MVDTEKWRLSNINPNKHGIMTNLPKETICGYWFFILIQDLDILVWLWISMNINKSVLSI